MYRYSCPTNHPDNKLMAMVLDQQKKHRETLGLIANSYNDVADYVNNEN